MANRFLETNYYKSPYVRGLKGALKGLYSFIICDCTASGIWALDIEAASLYIGFSVTMEEFEDFFINKNKAVFVSSGKYFFPDFIEHQYPSGLQDWNKSHTKIIAELNKMGFLREEKIEREAKGKIILSSLFFVKNKGALKGLYSPYGNGNGNGNGNLGGAGGEPEFPVKKNPKNYPCAENFKELPKVQFHTAILGVRNSSGITITEEQVIDLWENFKGVNLNGTKFYNDVEDVYTHFQRWITKQKIHNGTGTNGQKSKLGNKSGGFGILTDAIYKGKQ